MNKSLRTHLNVRSLYESLFSCLIAAFLLASCQSYKKVPYLQDAGVVKDINQQENLYDAKIMPKDLLTIIVSCTSPELAVPFNLTVAGPGSVAIGNTQLTAQPVLQPYLVVAVTNSSKHDFNRCKSATCKFLSRDTKSARDKNGTKPRKNKVKNSLPEISLVEYLCFVCKGTNLSLEKRGKIPISLIHNSFSYHCTPNVVIASDFDLKRLGLRKLGVKFCFAL